MKKYLLILIALISIWGCQRSTTKFITINNIHELSSIIKNNEEIILEISKSICPYCIELDNKESELHHDITIYKYVINEHTSDSDMDYLKSTLTPFEYVPTFYHIKDSKIVDYLIIHDWANPLIELNKWIDEINEPTIMRTYPLLVF